MKPVHFTEANKILTAPDCLPLPVHTDGRQCLSCWELNWRQRLSALVHGKVWLCTLTGQTQPPVWLDAARTIAIPKTQSR